MEADFVVVPLSLGALSAQIPTNWTILRNLELASISAAGPMEPSCGVPFADNITLTLSAGIQPYEPPSGVEILDQDLAEALFVYDVDGLSLTVFQRTLPVPDETGRLLTITATTPSARFDESWPTLELIIDSIGSGS